MMNAREMGILGAKRSQEVQRKKYGPDVFVKRMEYARKFRWKPKEEQNPIGLDNQR